MTQKQPNLQSSIRPRVALAAVAALALAGAVLLSDRAPLVLSEARARYATPDWFPMPIDDGLLHFAMWMGVTFLATLAVRSVRARLVVGVAAVLTSSAVEYLQIRLTFSRKFELADIVANTRGVYIGLAIGLIVGGVLDQIDRRRSSV